MRDLQLPLTHGITPSIYIICRFFSAHSKFRAHTRSFVRAESNFRLLLVLLYLVKLSMGERYYHLPFKRQVRNEDSLQQGAEIALISIFPV